MAQNAPPKEVVPFGEGGTPGFTYSQFSAAGGSGGIGVGDGMFGSKYGWYVKQIRDIVSANWQRSMVDANVRSAPRAYIYFEIQRDGSVANESIKAIQRSALAGSIGPTSHSCLSIPSPARRRNAPDGGVLFRVLAVVSIRSDPESS